jgi:hypothetical protein
VGAPTHFYAELCGNLAELICQESERHWWRHESLPNMQKMKTMASMQGIQTSKRCSSQPNFEVDSFIE